MSHRREPTSALERVSLGDLKSYLERSGWKRAPSTNERWTVYRLPRIERLEIVLPASESNIDSRERLVQAIATLGQVEERDTGEVSADLLSLNADSLLIRLQVHSEESLPLGEASRQVRAIRNLILYSTCSELQPRPYFDQPIEAAVPIANEFRFCHTYRGSFGFEVASTVVAPKTTADFFDSPLRRRAIERIARGVKVLSLAIEADDPDLLIRSYETALNARMCDALADISLDGGMPFLLGVDWATSWAPSEDVIHFPDHLVSEQHVSLLRFASDKLKVVEPRPDEIIGQVVNLHCVSDPVRGNAKRTIAVKVNHAEHGTIEVKLSLGPDAYLLAIDAHSKGKKLTAVGQLQRKGNTWTLEPVAKVAVADA